MVAFAPVNFIATVFEGSLLSGCRYFWNFTVLLLQGQLGVGDFESCKNFNFATLVGNPFFTVLFFLICLPFE